MLSARKQLDQPSNVILPTTSQILAFNAGFAKSLLLKDGSVPSLFGPACSRKGGI